MNRTALESVIQEFYDGAEKDEYLQQLVGEYSLVHRVTGVSDSQLLIKIFDYLDTKLQAKIKESL